MIRRCEDRDFHAIWEIVNDGAQAYRGVIPSDCWSDPYMSQEKLRREMDAGVVFWCDTDEGDLTGVMGMQQVRDVDLIRHAYVRTRWQKRGIGARLLAHFQGEATRPLLVGTWAAATWAIRFYQRHGFELAGVEEKDSLLRSYWTVPARQIETSVVLTDQVWRDRARGF